jgi:hypothetical protein
VKSATPRRSHVNMIGLRATFKPMLQQLVDVAATGNRGQCTLRRMAMITSQSARQLSPTTAQPPFLITPQRELCHRIFHVSTGGRCSTHGPHGSLSALFLTARLLI